MCGYSWRSALHGLWSCPGLPGATYTLYRPWCRPHLDEEALLEEYRKDMERELADVTERLKILKKQA